MNLKITIFNALLCALNINYGMDLSSSTIQEIKKSTFSTDMTEVKPKNSDVCQKESILLALLKPQEGIKEKLAYSLRKEATFKVPGTYKLTFYMAGNLLSCRTSDGDVHYLIDLSKNTIESTQSFIFLDNQQPISYVVDQKGTIIVHNNNLVILKHPIRNMVLSSDNKWLAFMDAQNEDFCIMGLDSKKIEKRTLEYHAQDIQNHRKFPTTFALRCRSSFRVVDLYRSTIYLSDAPADAIAFHPTESIIFTAMNNKIQCINYENRTKIELAIPITEGESKLHISYNGHLLCITTSDCVQLWQLSPMLQQLQVIAQQGSELTFSCFSPDGKKLVISDKNYVYIYSTDFS